MPDTIAVLVQLEIETFLLPGQVEESKFDLILSDPNEDEHQRCACGRPGRPAGEQHVGSGVRVLRTTTYADLALIQGVLDRLANDQKRLDVELRADLAAILERADRLDVLVTLLRTVGRGAH